MKTLLTEDRVQVLILLTVAGMAGAASFTHVHDWTMHNTPAGTGTWLGWANAVITELVPAGAGIEIRRRKRHHGPVTYPMAILITDAAVSLAAQLSDAVHTIAGGLAFALPALAFLALTKLILSRPGKKKEDNPAWTHPAPSETSPARTTDASAAPPATAPATPTVTAAPTAETRPASSAATPPPADTSTATDTQRDHVPVPSGQLLIAARMAAFAHQQATGQPITPGQLAERQNIPLTMAEAVLDTLGGTTPPPVTAVNGTALSGSRP